MSKITTVKKFLYGIGRYGLLRTVVGIVKFLQFKLFKPERGMVSTITDKIIINFEYPAQFMPTLVIFRQLVEPEYEFLRQILKPNSIFVDVGGGIGTYSIFVAKLINGSIHTFEPLQENLQIIKKNLKANCVESKVQLNPVALSSKEGYCSFQKEATLFLSRIKTSASGLNPDSNDNLVKTTTLDSYCSQKGIDFIDVIKIDVEGHEIEVIKGANKILSKNKIGIVILEVNPILEDFYASLENLGFLMFYYNISSKSLIPLSPISQRKIITLKPSPFHSNIIAITSEKVKQIQNTI